MAAAPLSDTDFRMQLRGKCLLVLSSTSILCDPDASEPGTSGYLVCILNGGTGIAPTLFKAKG
jgi:hypothetical protein